jgi:hypothetical protein
MSERQPVLSQINIVAKDFGACLDFYHLLGITISDRSPPDQSVRHAQATCPNGGR